MTDNTSKDAIKIIDTSERILFSSNDPKMKPAFEFIERFVKILEFDSATRGKILLMFISLEELIDNIIANHFCNNEKQALFASAVLRGLSFSKKLEILNKILKYSHPDTNKKIAKTLKQLQSMAELRNKLAHSMPYFEDLTKVLDGEEKIALTTYEENKKTSYVLSKSDVDNKIVEINHIYNALMKLLIEVRTKEKRI